MTNYSETGVYQRSPTGINGQQSEQFVTTKTLPFGENRPKKFSDELAVNPDVGHCAIISSKVANRALGILGIGGVTELDNDFSYYAPDQKCFINNRPAQYGKWLCQTDANYGVLMTTNSDKRSIGLYASLRNHRLLLPIASFSPAGKPENFPAESQCAFVQFPSDYAGEYDIVSTSPIEPSRHLLIKSIEGLFDSIDIKPRTQGEGNVLAFMSGLTGFEMDYYEYALYPDHDTVKNFDNAVRRGRLKRCKIRHASQAIDLAYGDTLNGTRPTSEFLLEKRTNKFAREVYTWAKAQLAKNIGSRPESGYGLPDSLFGQRVREILRIPYGVSLPPLLAQHVFNQYKKVFSYDFNASIEDMTTRMINMEGTQTDTRLRNEYHQGGDYADVDFQLTIPRAAEGYNFMRALLVARISTLPNNPTVVNLLINRTLGVYRQNSDGSLSRLDHELWWDLMRIIDSGHTSAYSKS